MLFQRISEAICDMSLYLVNTYQTDSILFAGGVSASSLIRKNLETKLSKMQIHFGEPALCTDNAAGIALLGGKKQWL
jgi:tRNA A37 threonylcarbamoyltransferase TsaD